MKKGYLYLLLSLTTASAAFAAIDPLTDATTGFNRAFTTGRYQDAHDFLGTIQLFGYSGDSRANTWLEENMQGIARVLDQVSTPPTDSVVTASIHYRGETRASTTVQAASDGSEVITDLERIMITGVNHHVIHSAFDALETMRALAAEDSTNAAARWLADRNNRDIIGAITVLATPEAIQQSRDSFAAGDRADQFHEQQRVIDARMPRTLDEVAGGGATADDYDLAEALRMSVGVASQGGDTATDAQLSLADALRHMSPTTTTAATAVQQAPTTSALRAHIAAHRDLTALRDMFAPVVASTPTIQANLTSLDALLGGDNPLLHQVLGASGILFGAGAFDRDDLTLTAVQASMNASVLPFMNAAAYSYNGGAVIPLQLQAMIDRSISTIERGITEATQLEAVRVLYSKAWTLASTMKTEGDAQGVKAMFDAVVGNIRDAAANNADKINRVFLAYTSMLQHLGVMQL